METTVKKQPYGEVVIIKFTEDITFTCQAVGLDAVYNIKTKKITGKGSKSCESFILNEVEKILNN